MHKYNELIVSRQIADELILNKMNLCANLKTQRIYSIAN